MADITIRIAGHDDAAACSAVLKASYETQWRGFYDPDDLAAVLPVIVKANPKLLASGNFFIAFASDKPAGCGGWSLGPPQDPAAVTPGLGHIRHFAVHPDHLRKGIGRRLFEACAEQARPFGVTRFEAQSSLPAVDFYARLGFRKTERIELAILGLPALPCVRMVSGEA